jgi:hypothetical protein
MMGKFSLGLLLTPLDTSVGLLLAFSDTICRTPRKGAVKDDDRIITWNLLRNHAVIETSILRCFSSYFHE